MTPEQRIREAADACRATKDPFTYRFAACERHFADAIRAALRERDARWLAVVKEIEWRGNLGQNYSGCTICDSEERSGHSHDCALRALLEEAGK